MNQRRGKRKSRRSQNEANLQLMLDCLGLDIHEHDSHPAFLPPTFLAPELYDDLDTMSLVYHFCSLDEYELEAFMDELFSTAPLSRQPHGVGRRCKHGKGSSSSSTSSNSDDEEESLTESFELVDADEIEYEFVEKMSLDVGGPGTPEGEESGESRPVVPPPPSPPSFRELRSRLQRLLGRQFRDLLYRRGGIPTDTFAFLETRIRQHFEACPDTVCRMYRYARHLQQHEQAGCRGNEQLSAYERQIVHAIAKWLELVSHSRFDHHGQRFVALRCNRQAFQPPNTFLGDAITLVRSAAAS